MSMEHWEERTVTQNTLVKTTCDICGCEIKTHDGGMPMKVNQVTIEHEDYKSWPDDVTGKGTLAPDICGKCFEDKILPFLRSIGLRTEYI
jgi:hypothetical protein